MQEGVIMLKELKKDSQYLYINYELVKKCANKIKLMIDNETIYEGKISSDLVFELKTFKIGKFARLYVEINGDYLFLDKEIITYDIIRLSNEKINKYINEFIRDLGCILNED